MAFRGPSRVLEGDHFHSKQHALQLAITSISVRRLTACLTDMCKIILFESLPQKYPAHVRPTPPAIG